MKCKFCKSFLLIFMQMMGDGGAHSLLRFTLRSLRQECRPSPLYSDISALFSETAGWGYSSQIETARYLIPVAARPDLVVFTTNQSRVTSLFILRSASFAQTATRGRSTVHRSGIPCAPRALEFRRLGTCARFPSRSFRPRPA